MAYTNCALTTGFDLDCRDAVGGVKSVSFANLDDYLALTPVVTAGAITSITATATFYKYEQLKETSSLNFIGMSKSNVITLDVQEKIITKYPKNIPEWLIDNYDNLLTNCVKR